MRIGIDGLLLHGMYSGVEHAIDQLLHALARRGDSHEYLVYVGSDLKASPWDGERVRAHRLRLPARWRLLRVAATHTLLARLAARDGVELFHGPGYVLPQGWRGRSVLTLYDIIALTHPTYCHRANRAYYRLLVPRSARQADAIIVPTASTKADVVQHLRVPEQKVHVVPLGVREHFRPASRQHVAVVRERHRLPQRYSLFVGNAEPKKNLEATLAGYHRAVLRSDEAPLLVLAGGKGWGPQGLTYARPAYGGELSWARAIGYVPEEDLPALYTGASFLLLWSRWEGFGLPALEAMACRTPVICSDCGGLPEVVGDAAEVVPIGDTRALADAICRMVADQTHRQTLIARGLAQAARFSWRSYAQRVVEAYEEVASLGQAG